MPNDEQNLTAPEPAAGTTEATVLWQAQVQALAPAHRIVEVAAASAEDAEDLATDALAGDWSVGNDRPLMVTVPSASLLFNERAKAQRLGQPVADEDARWPVRIDAAIVVTRIEEISAETASAASAGAYAADKAGRWSVGGTLALGTVEIRNGADITEVAVGDVTRL